MKIELRIFLSLETKKIRTINLFDIYIFYIFFYKDSLKCIHFYKSNCMIVNITFLYFVNNYCMKQGV